MYLAEDRILCLKLYSILNKSYNMAYAPLAKAVVDPMKHFLSLRD